MIERGNDPKPWEPTAAERAALDAAVDAFAAEMKAKLRAKARAGWSGWNTARPERWIGPCFDHLRRMDRGDIRQAVDVANLAMFAWFCGRKKRS